MWSSRDDSCWEEKEFVKIENTLSDAAEQVILAYML